MSRTFGDIEAGQRRLELAAEDRRGITGVEGQDLFDLARFADETTHMIVIDVLKSTGPVGFAGERLRLFLTDAGYNRAVQSQEQGEIAILSHALVSKGKLIYS